MWADLQHSPRRRQRTKGVSPALPGGCALAWVLERRGSLGSHPRPSRKPCPDRWWMCYLPSLNITLNPALLFLVVACLMHHCERKYWENLSSSKVRVSYEREFQVIENTCWMRTDHSNSKCKIIHIISSQLLPQVVLGMLEIMKYKMPLLHVTCFPHD